METTSTVDPELDEFAVCRCLQDPPFPAFYDQAGSDGSVGGKATCKMSINEQRLKLEAPTS